MHEILASHEKGGAMRIGQGFDVHAFGEGDHVVLGGVAHPARAGASWRTPTATW